jgi:hypothetical protein
VGRGNPPLLSMSLLAFVVIWVVLGLLFNGD